jgi:hypothetical protein
VQARLRQDIVVPLNSGSSNPRKISRVLSAAAIGPLPGILSSMGCWYCTAVILAEVLPAMKSNPCAGIDVAAEMLRDSSIQVDLRRRMVLVELMALVRK